MQCDFFQFYVLFTFLFTFLKHILICNYKTITYNVGVMRILRITLMSILVNIKKLAG